MSHQTAAVILAAGRSTRFGSEKMLAEFRGRPILQHVLDLAALAGLRPVVVVTSPLLTELSAPLIWRDEQRVTNTRPETGLADSLRLGLAALEQGDARRALVMLGDQPLLSKAQLTPLLAADVDAMRPIVVPRYSGRQGNPVLLERPAWALAKNLAGDRGMSQVIERYPELVRYVDVRGTNPDVDTPADLAVLVSDEG